MATDGDRVAIACRPSRRNRLPMSLVKVLSCGTMTADALSIMAGLKPLKQVQGHRFAIASLKELGFTP